ncbi:uncharacterized protein SPSC_01145 [Sporisorium scitamineum]|uniref:Uncharacterized protein n=1 Tax=Sporisorium scitamineum TaxID=49012 RepID=A0A127Z960_9BASI|nr:uncharacterized protein SPSC_01145 [Sporisorium scitamineum]
MASAPITAGGISAEYTQKFKKHFGDRPVAFALSSSSSYPTHNSFAASSSSSATEGRAGVDTETHNQLANLGWRIRSRVNQGYTRTSTCVDPFGGEGFVSERDILRNVTNTRRGWSRVATAPTIASTFDELRTGTLGSVADDNEMIGNSQPAIDAGVKRSRRLSESGQEEPQDTLPGQGGQRRLAGLPKLSFSSSISSTSSQDACFPTFPTHLQTFSRRFARHSSSHSLFNPPPIQSDVVEMDTDMADDVMRKVERAEAGAEAGEGYDFSSHFNRTDF